MPPKARPESTPWFKNWLVKSALLLVVVIAFLGALLLAGRWCLEELRGQKRYDVPSADIECVPPVDMTKHDFLDEVIYLARLPRYVQLLDENLRQHLRDAFAKHPWVERVDAIEIIPPNRIVVTLTYRTPVLAVTVGAKTRAVDGSGVLLPANAPTAGLPIFTGAAKPHKDEGKRWGDPNVEAAARKLKK